MGVTLHLTDIEGDVLVIESTFLQAVIDDVAEILGDERQARAYLESFFAEKED